MVALFGPADTSIHLVARDLSTLLHKARLMLVRVFLWKTDIIYLQSSFRELQPLPEFLLVALQGFGGKLLFSDSLPVFFLN